MSVNLGSLIFDLPPERRKSVRALEKVSTKLIKQKCSLLFNSVCLKEDILPTYSNIKLHNQAARKEPFTLKYRRRLVEREVGNAKTNIELLEKDHRERTASLRSVMDEHTLTPILGKIKESCKSEVWSIRVNIAPYYPYRISISGPMPIIGTSV